MQLAKYQIQEELGRGAMGTVYKAWDPLLDRFVSIKLISGAFQEKLKTLFEREAKSIAKMSDPNIITIFDFNYYENQPYIVMELLKGLNLEELAKRTDLDLPQKLDIVLQICRGLNHAHEQNIIHRDIKPSNIFLTENAVAKIMDFGIARLTTATQTHALLGTPEYMSPEQILGDPLDGRSDLFSLGTLLYWFLTGNSPFIADGVHPILHNIVNKVPAPVTVPQLNDIQMKELQKILDRSMAKKPDDRYSSASEMEIEIDRFMRQLKEAGVVESLSLKQRVKSIVSELEKQKESRKFIGATQMEDVPIDRTIQVAGKKVPTLPPPTKEKKTEIPAITKRSVVLRSIGLIGIVALIFGAYWIFVRPRVGANSATSASTSPAIQGQQVELVIAFGSDKHKWVNNLTTDFQKTSAGKNVRVKLEILGYSEATEALMSGKRKIDVWWPSSTLPEELFLTKWKNKYGTTLQPAKRELALSSMIFLIWEDKYLPFINKYKKMNFHTLYQAMSEKKGWADIAGRPEWGLFGFGHADPSESNTGLMMLQLLAQEYFGKADELSESDVQNPGFQQFLKSFHRKAKVLSANSEGVMQEMIMKGPSTYDVAFVSENVAIDYLSEAEGRWGKFHIVYPEYNMWSENPYYIIDAPWVSTDQRKVAQKFLDFVSQNSEQQKALNHGFRPADTSIPLRIPGSPFIRYQDLGLQIQIGTTCEYPTPEALAMLIQSWKS